MKWPVAESGDSAHQRGRIKGGKGLCKTVFIFFFILFRIRQLAATTESYVGTNSLTHSLFFVSLTRTASNAIIEDGKRWPLWALCELLCYYYSRAEQTIIVTNGVTVTRLTAGLPVAIVVLADVMPSKLTN